MSSYREVEFCCNSNRFSVSHSPLYLCTHTHTHTHTYAHTHKHTHTHTYIRPKFILNRIFSTVSVRLSGRPAFQPPTLVFPKPNMKFFRVHDYNPTFLKPTPTDPPRFVFILMSSKMLSVNRNLQKRITADQSVFLCLKVI